MGETASLAAREAGAPEAANQSPALVAVQVAMVDARHVQSCKVAVVDAEESEEVEVDKDESLPKDKDG